MKKLIVYIDTDNSNGGVNEVRIPHVLRVSFTGWKFVTTADGDEYIVLCMNGHGVATLGLDYNEQFLRAVGDI